MPRKARRKSKTKIYHISLRGANRQEIFHEEEDRTRFLDTVNKSNKKSRSAIYGWCLMSNHVHLLMKEGTESISITMKRIGISYAMYYNHKYSTVGHLFQDRFKSEQVETETYLLSVIRYIHQNPVKAKMVMKPDQWKWSSCRAYHGNGAPENQMINTSFILQFFAADK